MTEYQFPKQKDFACTILKVANELDNFTIKDILNDVCDRMGIPDESRNIMVASGNQTVVRNKCEWAKLALKKAGALEQVAFGKFKITSQGKKILTLPEFEIASRQNEPLQAEMTATERAVYEAAQQNEEVEKQILDTLYAVDAYKFERLIVKLLEKMNYGTVVWTGKPGDGGVDAIINEDKLGVHKIYVQAKRYAKNNQVGDRDVKHFTGCMEANKITHGILVTTSTFSSPGEKAIMQINKRIEMIDGKRLAHLMQVYDMGARTTSVITFKEFDSSIFEED